MINCEMEVDKDKGILTITIDLNQESGRSKSGKTIIVASTQGNQTVYHGFPNHKIGINCYRYPTAEDE